jgi:hypothetical protein
MESKGRFASFPLALHPNRHHSGRYILYFAEPAEEIKPLKLVSNGRVKAPQAPRYTSMERIRKAKTLDEAF